MTPLVKISASVITTSQMKRNCTLGAHLAPKTLLIWTVKKETEPFRRSTFSVPA